MTPTSPPRAVRWITGLMALVVAFCFGRAAAQSTDDGLSTGEIAISCPWFGVGGLVRPGEWAALQLKLNDSSDKPREILVRVLMNDADGDKIMWETAITTNPGVSQPVWAYVRIPSRFRASEPLKVTAHIAIERSGAAAGDTSAWSAGRQVASASILCRQLVSSSEGMLGIVGTRVMGLGKYSGPGLGNYNYLPTGHERWEIVQRIDPDTMPDRWMGLMQFAALVWNDPLPGALNSEKAQALREWVQRGGHLIIVLPAISQTWTDQANNPLFDITPRVKINRIEGYNLEPLRTLISRLPREPNPNDPLKYLEMPTNEVLQTMVPLPGASPEEASCVIAMPTSTTQSNPEWLVARRQAGLGMVSMVGLNAASRWMEQKALPDPELFWHRILGRRGEMTVAKESGESSTNLSSFARVPITLDNSIADQIAKTTLAGAGVLMGLAIFVIYWLVAGPLGYAALKKTGRQRHTWVGFVAAAGLFTGIAWGGATIIRPAKVSAAHLTILDHVYTPLGESVQRARSWMSVLIPEYGEASVAVGDPSKAGSAKFHNLITPWEPENASTAGFPDARAYQINSRAPDHYKIPTRSTVKQFQVDWAGGPVWIMPRPLPDAQGKPTELTARVAQVRATANAPTKESAQLTGMIAHELPEALRDVVILVNTGQTPLNTSFAGKGAWRETANVFVAALKDPWEAKVALDLSKITDFSPGDGKDAFFRSLLAQLGSYADGRESMGSRNLSELTVKMRALAFFGAIEPPNLDDQTRNGSYVGKPLIRRRSTHSMDLSQWFTQPCIIITGYIGKDDNAASSASPVPLMVSTGGTYIKVPTTGRTFVRWVYPLPANPPAFKSNSDAPLPQGEQPPVDGSP